MKELFEVKDKCIVITGGAGLLCGCMGAELARRGAKICIVDCDASRAKELCKNIEADGGFAFAAGADVLDKESVRQAFDTAIKTMGRADILINGAGGNKKEATTSADLSFFDIPPEAFKAVLDLNFLGTLLPTQIFGKHLAERGDGVILNISSMSVFRPLTNISAYSAAKAAVSNFTQWLAVHMCQNYSKDIRVNAIAPGFFLTEQNRFLLTDEQSGELTGRGKTIVDHTPMAKFGQPKDLIGTVLWLVSDASRFITGIVVPVDGGFSAFSGV
jgi:NAD(P)-dependent dehydrogenase (short-subunit alcohol dehydrogenase family)